MFSVDSRFSRVRHAARFGLALLVVGASVGQEVEETAVETIEALSAPAEVPSDLIEPTLSSRDTSSDQFARIFSADLREVELRQTEILKELETLPRLSSNVLSPVQLGYHSGSSKQRPKWVQIDLGEVVEPEAIALVPITIQLNDETFYGYGFPQNFRIDISEDPEFRKYQTLVDYRQLSEPRPRLQQAPFFLPVNNARGRYVRVTATRLWTPPGKSGPADGVFALAEMMVLKGDRNLAVGKTVRSLDAVASGRQWNRLFLTDGRTPLGVPHMRVESSSLGFRVSSKGQQSRWVQIDMGEAMPIEEIRVIPAADPEEVVAPTYEQFPRQFKLEISNTPDMRNADLVGLFSGNAADPNNPMIIPVEDGHGRYVRLTVENKDPGSLVFAVAEMQIYSDNQNASVGKAVLAAESVENGEWSTKFLVDGYGSRHQLADYQAWLSSLSLRGKLIQEWREKEAERVDLVETTVSRGVRWGGGGMGLLTFFTIFGLARSRRERAGDLEKLRQQIASDLHDDIGSNLSSIALIAELGVLEAEDPEIVREEFQEIKATSDKTIESMRDIIWLIRPHEENWKELLARFRETAAKMLRAHQYKFDTSGHVPEDSLPLDFKRDVFLIYKEVLNNIVKHANATRVHIELDIRRHQLTLKVTDDGKGFDNLKKGFREGNGLRNLRTRAQNLGGSLKVRSGPDDGTSIQLIAPVK